LQEYSKTNPVFAFLAAIAVFLSAVVFTASSKTPGKSNIKGIILASLAALGFGSVAVIQKYITTNIGIYSQQVVWSLSILMSLFLYILIKGKIKEIFKSSSKDIGLSLGAGILYLGASLFQLFSYNFLAASISFTIIQMNAFWTITIGILVFKEINLKKYYKNVVVGFLFTALGILFLVFARK
jgi:glucose uptake protein GlcU